MLHKYLMEVRCWFSGYEQFVIEAENKKDAVEKGRQFIINSTEYRRDNYNLNDVRCVKKLQK